MLENSERSTAAVRHFYDVLNITLSQAVKWQIISTNPCIHVQPPNNKNKRIKMLTPEQVEILLEYTKASEFNVMYMPILLALTYGMRRVEILDLKWEDVDSESGLLHIRNNLQMIKGEFVLLPTKTDLSQSSVALLPSTISILKQYENGQKVFKMAFKSEYTNCGYVCSRLDGSPLRPDYLTKTIKKLLEKCNLPDIRFHDLRHTHATLLLMAGINPKVVAERLGHSKVDMTLDTYSHVLSQMQKEAAEKLDERLFKR